LNGPISNSALRDDDDDLDFFVVLIWLRIFEKAPAEMGAYFNLSKPTIR